MCQNPTTGVEETDITPAEPAVDALTDVVNVGGLRELFRALEVEALVCRGGMNVMYLSGIAMPGTLGRHLDLAETARETFVVWPAGGDPVGVVSDIASEVARTTSRIRNLRTYRDYVENPEVALAETIRELSLDRSRVGFDQGWFGARRWSALRRLLPGVDCVDATDELDAVRAIKTPTEVELLRRAAAILDRALTDVFRDVLPGQSERHVHAAVSARALELGAGTVHGILQSSSNQVLYGGESDVRLAAGDMVRTDYVAYVDGYAANLSRLLHVGRPSEDIKRVYATYLGMYREAVGLLRPGARGGDVHRSIRAMFERRGWQPGPAISGHGVGVWFHQQYPMLVEGSADVLESGMVLAIEPISGHWHLQDEYLITDRGPLRISDTFDLDHLPWAA